MRYWECVFIQRFWLNVHGLLLTPTISVVHHKIHCCWFSRCWCLLVTALWGCGCEFSFFALTVMHMHASDLCAFFESHMQLVACQSNQLLYLESWSWFWLNVHGLVLTPTSGVVHHKIHCLLQFTKAMSCCHLLRWDCPFRWDRAKILTLVSC